MIEDTRRDEAERADEYAPARRPWLRGRRLAVAVAVAGAGIGSVLVTGGLQIADTSGDGRSAADRRLAVGGVEGSTPVDSEAKFYWEMPTRPRSLIPLDEIRSGGPPPDGIPPIDDPQFETVAEASRWLDAREPVVAFERGGDARAYPLQIMTWHEIVNDVVGGDPVAVTYCPLCNSTIVFDRRVGDRVLDFGTSGRLWHSDLVMYDRQTKSLWPQIRGQAVVGPLIETELEPLASSIVSWGEWRETHPKGRVLSRSTGFSRDYGRNPYQGYDNPDGFPFLFDGSSDPRLPAMTRVLAIEIDGDAIAYTFELLARGAPTARHDRLAGTEFVVFYERGTASALDADSIRLGRDVGATGVFRRTVDGRRLTFEAREGGFVDAQTRSTWNVLGKATSGPLAGRSLEPIAHINTFWFAWGVFMPDTDVRR